MTKFLFPVLAWASCLAVLGCGGEEPAQEQSSAFEVKAESPAKNRVVEDEAAAETGAGGSERAAEKTAAEAGSAAKPEPVASETKPAGGSAGAVDPMHEKLIGTEWMVGDYHVAFKDAETVRVKGGPLATLAPNGLDATYKLEDGIIEVQAMGQTRTGTWDGEELVVDGNVAQPKK